jgi:hypothetical protein
MTMTAAILIATLIHATRIGAMTMIVIRITNRIIAIIATITLKLTKLESVDAMLNTAPSSHRARIEIRPEVEPSLTSTTFRYRLSIVYLSAELAAGGKIVLK